MKLLVPTLVLVAVASVGALRLGGLCPLAVCALESAPAAPPAGRLLVSRSADASGAESAVLAWDFDRGSVDGRAVGGLAAVAEVTCEGSLDDPGAARRSIVYLDRALGIEGEDLVLGLLKANAADALGEIAALKYGRLSVELERGGYAVAVDERIALEGETGGGDGCCGASSDGNVQLCAFSFDAAPLSAAEVEQGLPACCSPAPAAPQAEQRLP
jgi:hypothetical protein